MRARTSAAWGSAAVLLAALAVSLWRSTSLVLAQVAAGQPESPGQYVQGWPLSQYWLDHGDGFVRRALPGELLARATGGVPTLEQAQRTGLGLTLAGAAGVLVLVALLVAAARGAWRRAALAAVLLTSPLTLSLPARDLGRYDAVALVALPLLALLPWRRGRAGAWGSAAVAGVVVAAAAGSQEFLVAVLAPVVVLGLLRAPLPRAARAAAALVALGPGLAVAGASARLPVPPGAVAGAVAEGERAGAFLGAVNAVTVIGQPWDAQVQMVRGLHPATVALSLLVLGGLAVLTGLLAWVLTGRRRGRAALAAGACCAAVALALGAVGVDHRRWWMLGLLAFLACLVRLVRDAAGSPAGTRGAAPGLRLQAAAVLLAVAGLPVQDAPLYPRWDPGVPGTTAAQDAADGLSVPRAALHHLLGEGPAHPLFGRGLLRGA
ncbi:hypothetical protein NUM3379_33290 [Kineococcus sp. NUM-3379]